MAEYTQLNLEERKMLFQLKRKKTPVAKIAVQLKRARSTINRELKRNVTDHNLGYLPDSANQKALERKSITFDNGVEFTRHGLLKKHLNMDTYFCDKHPPWQKGQAEQMNSMIHRFMPKKKSIKEATEEMINSVQDALNNMPRKCLGFRTPAEVYNEELLKCGALQH